MNDLLISIWHYLLKVGISTITQLVVLFGPLLVLGLLMHFLSLFNQKLNIKLLGQTLYIYLFGWLGTSIHEMGHAVFALLFGHQITDIKLFKPDPQSGTLGYVKHTYNAKNLYHQTGNFFIGIGPVLMCVAVLYFLSIWLFRVPFSDFPDLKFSTDQIGLSKWLAFEMKQVWQFLALFLQTIFSPESFVWWKLVVFIYCFYSVGSFITLSPSDIKSAVKGFLVIVFLFFAFNCATLWLGNFAIESLTKANVLLSGFYSIMLLSILLQLLFVLVIGLSLLVKSSFN